jgi:hypothetical protein
MKEHLKLLGFKVKDAVTGFTGTVTSVTFDLYGCVAALVTPDLDKDRKIGDAQWFDTKRLTAVSKKPVMTVPTFEVVPGGQQRPLR